MYLTEPRGPVVALDARTGRSLWRWDPVLPKDLRTLGFGPSNRGVALLDGTVFVGTLDAKLVALDALSGAVRWTVGLAENKLGYAITSAPLAIDGQVIVGVSGGEAGIRGFLDSYDAKTGARRWRFETIPGPGEPGHETWSGDSWKTGGGPDLADRGLRSRAGSPLLGHRQPRPRLERRRASRRQPLHLLAGRPRGEDRPHALAFPVHPPRHPRLGRQPDPGAARRGIGGTAAQARAARQPQRLLLRPRSYHRRVPARRALREADLGAGPRREGTTHPHRRPGAEREGHA